MPNDAAAPRIYFFISRMIDNVAANVPKSTAFEGFSEVRRRL
jgi:hypothetical protein